MAGLIGTKRIGADMEDKRSMVLDRIRRRTEEKLRKSRQKILELRKRYKHIVRRNEEKMEKRQKHRVKLGPTCVSLMPSRRKAKQIRSAVGSQIPAIPKFSQAITHARRIYGRRFAEVE